MEQYKIKRIGLGILLVAGVFLAPYWLVIFLGAVIAIFIPYYVEFTALVVLEEVLYHSAGVAVTTMIYPLSLFAFFVILEVSRSFVRERFLRI